MLNNGIYDSTYECVKVFQETAKRIQNQTFLG